MVNSKHENKIKLKVSTVNRVDSQYNIYTVQIYYECKKRRCGMICHAIALHKRQNEKN